MFMECVQTFKSNHLLATTILLGTASERLVDALAEHLRDALGSTRDGSGWFSSYQSKWAITRKFDEVLRKLQQEYQSELNSARLSDRELQAIKLAFEAIRNPRNIIAHEHNYNPTWNEAGGLMHNFVLYFKLANQIIGVLLANPR